MFGCLPCWFPYRLGTCLWVINVEARAENCRVENATFIKLKKAAGDETSPHILSLSLSLSLLSLDSFEDASCFIDQSSAVKTNDKKNVLQLVLPSPPPPSSQRPSCGAKAIDEQSSFPRPPGETIYNKKNVAVQAKKKRWKRPG